MERARARRLRARGARPLRPDRAPRLAPRRPRAAGARSRVLPAPAQAGRRGGGRHGERDRRDAHLGRHRRLRADRGSDGALLRPRRWRGARDPHAAHHHPLDRGGRAPRPGLVPPRGARAGRTALAGRPERRAARGAGGHRDRDHAVDRAGRGRDRAAALHRAREPLLVREARPADRLAAGDDLRLRPLALSRLDRPGVDRGARPLPAHRAARGYHAMDDEANPMSLEARPAEALPVSPPPAPLPPTPRPPAETAAVAKPPDAPARVELAASGFGLFYGAHRSE